MAHRVSRRAAMRGKRLKKGCRFVKGDGAICGLSRKKGKGKCKRGRRKDGKCRKRWKR